MNAVEHQLLSVDKAADRRATSSALAAITSRPWGFLALVLVMDLSTLAYVAKQGLSFRALFMYGLV